MNLKEYFSHDLLASIVVFLVALPLCLGIALASGAPLHAGLIAGVVGGIVAGSLSGSPLSVAGPAAGLTTIVIAAINDLGSYEIFLCAVVLAGVIQLTLGFIKAGAIGHFFPASVIKGMLAAIGLILILKQIPHAVGFDHDYEGDQSFFQQDGLNTFTEIIAAMDAFSAGAAIVSLVTIGIILIWGRPWLQRRKIFSLVPAPLVAVIAGILLALFFANSVPELAISQEHMVDVPNFLAAGTALDFPDFTKMFNRKVLMAGVTIAIVASLESLLSIEACDKMDPLRRITPLNRELKAQGTANLISGLLGGLPVTSVIVRSSTNIASGAKSKASAITHGVILLLSILLIPTLLRLIPLSCLAGVLILVGFKLTPPSLYKQMYEKGWAQFLPFIITVLAIVFSNLLIGVFIGILVSVFFILRTNFRAAILLVNNGKDYLLKLRKDVSFLNKSTLRNIFLSIPSNSTLLIDGSEAHFVDQDIKEAIRDFIETSKAKQIQVQFKHLDL
jgi:MFS superfamily sulfate permease-like transporter